MCFFFFKENLSFVATASYSFEIALWLSLITVCLIPFPIYIFYFQAPKRGGKAPVPAKKKPVSIHHFLMNTCIYNTFDINKLLFVIGSMTWINRPKVAIVSTLHCAIGSCLVSINSLNEKWWENIKRNETSLLVAAFFVIHFLLLSMGHSDFLLFVSLLAFLDLFQEHWNFCLWLANAVYY